MGWPLRVALSSLCLGLVFGSGCSSSDEASSSSPCEAFCKRFATGKSCGGLEAIEPCKADCATLSAQCPARASALLACLSRLSYECPSPGNAVAKPSPATANEYAYLTASSGTIEVQDSDCAERVREHQACESGTGGTGGGNGCQSTHPYHCASTNSCWKAEMDCSSVKSCGGAWVGCTATESQKGEAVDCAYKACVPTPGGCAGNATHPVYCPASNGANPGCWTSGTECSTVVECKGLGGKSCSAPSEAVDCSANKCLAPKVMESTDATCSNGIDDDGNGFADCKDFHCTANPSVTVCKTAENDDVACSNGIDDDTNGFTDCKDFTCQISPSVTVCPGERSDAECHDGLDNDGDGKTDCADPTCFGSPFTKCP